MSALDATISVEAGEEKSPSTPKTNLILPSVGEKTHKIKAWQCYLGSKDKLQEEGLLLVT